MFNNYLKVTFRNLKKDKWFSFLNITGLGLALAVSLLMLTYVIYENSYDGFQKNGDHIYRIAVQWGNSVSNMKFAGAMPALASAVRESFPEVLNACRIKSGSGGEILLPDNSKSSEDNFYFADKQMLDMFSVELIKGDNKTALDNPLNVMLSETMAKKYFPGKNPLGQSLNYEKYDFKVTGVFKDIPKNTHLFTEFIASYSSMTAIGQKESAQWDSFGNDLTYVQLNGNVSLDDFNGKLHNLLAANASPQLAGKIVFVIHNIKDLHWVSDGYSETGSKSKRIYLYIFLSAGLLVLIIACFNFMNLSTARYLDKFKEVGVRKVLGASRFSLMKQFISESVTITIVALAIGFIIFMATYDKLYNYLSAGVFFETTHIISIGLVMILLVLLVGVIAGSYPAWFLSRFNPANTIRKNISVPGRFSFRQISTVIQYAFSILLLFGTFAVNNQINYVMTTDIGIDKDNILMLFSKPGTSFSQSDYDVLRTELLKEPNIAGVTGAFSLPGIRSRAQMSIRVKGEPVEKMTQVQSFPVDYDFANTLGIKVLSGRTFSPEIGGDADNSILLNESAVKMLGLTNPIGQIILLGGSKEVTVVGVVKDFNIYSLQNKINPVMISVRRKGYSVLALHYRKENEKLVLASIKDTYSKIFPNQNYTFKFMKDAYAKMYESEGKIKNMLSLFTLLTILITSIGIIGFTSYIAAKKTKEIAVRKVLGASVSEILFIFLKQFVAWVVVAFIFMAPVCHYFASEWLNQYAYKGEISILIYVLPMIITLTITIAIIGIQTFKTAIANPVDSLRSE